MTWLRLAFANLGLSPLTSAVNVLLMSLGTASIVLLLLAGSQVSDTMSRDAKGIDLVLGAKGSPVQLVLAAVYHADVPPGNISLQAADRWANDSRIAQAIPMSLGDSYRGFRIVGTTESYADLYGAEVESGRFWTESMEAVIGSAAAEAAALDVGSQFASAHGLVDGGYSHDYAPYEVVGVLAPTGTVLDRLILTSLDSVWDLHAEDAHHNRDTGHGHFGSPDRRALDHRREGVRLPSHDYEEAYSRGRNDEMHAHAREQREITAMLLRYRSPMAAVALPRQINADSALQAAAPAMEVSRILQLVGIGLDGLEAFAWVLIVTAALSVFAALYGSLRSRRRDLAMLRCLGATRRELLMSMLLEGLLLSFVGIALGFATGHVAMEVLGRLLENARGVALAGWIWLPEEWILMLTLFAVGAVAAAIPAVQAYRTDPARILAEA